VGEVVVDEIIGGKRRARKKMTKRESWTAKFEEASENLNEWRKQKPKATFTEIENSVDKQLAQVRTEMIKELAMESELTDFKQLKGKERPKCPGCGKPLAANGKQKRRLRTTQGEEVELERRKGYCRDCRASFFPPG
jgi:RNase P subunit RPR2